LNIFFNKQFGQKIHYKGKFSHLLSMLWTSHKNDVMFGAKITLYVKIWTRALTFSFFTLAHVTNCWDLSRCVKMTKNCLKSTFVEPFDLIMTGNLVYFYMKYMYSRLIIERFHLSPWPMWPIFGSFQGVMFLNWNGKKERQQYVWTENSWNIQKTRLWRN